MEQQVLTDRSQVPTEEIIYSHIGKSKILWSSMFEYIHATYPEIKEEWRYYNDGKRWLMKVTRKLKTVFWLSILKDAFRITFYFTDKAAKALAESDISDRLKDDFREGKRYNKIRGVTIVMKSKRDVKDAKILIAIKLSLK